NLKVTRRIRVILIGCIFFPAITIAQSGPGAKAEFRMVPNGKIYIITQTDADYTFDSARYSVFIPDSVDVIQGVFIHQHGCTMEGRGMSTAYDIQYQAFAKKWKLAVVGPDLYSAKGNCHDWKNPESGSASALF